MTDSRQIDRNSARIERNATERQRFIAHPPGKQDHDTHRQFVQLQTVLEQMQRRIEDLEAAP